MRLVIGLLPMAQDRSRGPRDTMEKRIEWGGGHFVVCSSMDGLPSRQVIQVLDLSSLPARGQGQGTRPTS